MGRKYGSKEAYEASRKDAREWQRRMSMSEEERRKERNLDRLQGDDGMMTYMLLLAAGMAGGKSAKGAIAEADIAMSELKKRFT